MCSVFFFSPTYPRGVQPGDDAFSVLDLDKDGRVSRKEHRSVDPQRFAVSCRVHRIFRWSVLHSHVVVVVRYYAVLKVSFSFNHRI